MTCQPDWAQTDRMSVLKRHKTAYLTVFALVWMVVFTRPSDAFFFQQEKITTAKGLAHYAMGQVYDLLGMTKYAALEYEKAAQFDPSAYRIRLRLGADYARLGILDRAVEELQLAARLKDDDLQVHYLLALIYSTQKDYDRAAWEYEYILKKFSTVEPQNIAIYSYLGQLYYSQRKYDQAVVQFEHILEIDPKNTDVMYLLGSLYLETGRKDKAIQVLKKALTIDPNHDGCLNTLGYIYVEDNVHLDEAEELIKKALAVQPDNGAYLDSLGWLYYKKGQYPEALKTLKKAAKALEDPVIYEHIGDVYFKMSSFEDARRYWQKSLDLMPQYEAVRKKLESLEANHAAVENDQ